MLNQAPAEVVCSQEFNAPKIDCNTQ